jgi:hypothetical protein
MFAEVDGDGVDDLVLTGGGFVRVWRNVGDGTFRSLYRRTLASGRSSAAGDVDGDGDLVVTNGFGTGNLGPRQLVTFSGGACRHLMPASEARGRRAVDDVLSSTGVTDVSGRSEAPFPQARSPVRSRCRSRA